MLSSVKSTCAGDGVVAAAAGYGSVSATAAGGGSVADVAGDRITVGRTGFLVDLERGQMEPHAYSHSFYNS